MRIWKNLSAGLRSLFHKEETEQELDDELHDYLEKAVVEKMRRGMARGEDRNGRRGSGERKSAGGELGDARGEPVE